MRVAIAGGTGVVGRLTVEAIRGSGHEAVVLARSTGVELVSGNGLAEALAGADAVIDVSNIAGTRASVVSEFFEATSRNLMRASAQARVRHIVTLSIIGVDRIPFGYYQGKLRQEKVLAESRVPVSILRAAQFHEFPGQYLARSSRRFVVVPRWRTQPVAAREVATALAALATGSPVPVSPTRVSPTRVSPTPVSQPQCRQPWYRSWRGQGRRTWRTCCARSSPRGASDGGSSSCGSPAPRARRWRRAADCPAPARAWERGRSPSGCASDGQAASSRRAGSPGEPGSPGSLGHPRRHHHPGGQRHPASPLLVTVRGERLRPAGRGVQPGAAPAGPRRVRDPRQSRRRRGRRGRLLVAARRRS